MGRELNWKNDLYPPNIFTILNPNNEELKAPIYKVRYLATRDIDMFERTEWLSALFHSFDQRIFNDDETYILSRSSHDYDIFALGGSDAVRMSRYLRTNRAILHAVPKLAILSNSTPAKRARLLNSGFDEVFDSARTTIVEARARVEVIIRSSRYSDISRISIEAKAASIAHICAPSSLTTREFRVLSALSDHFGKAVSVRDLCRLVDPADDEKFKRSIKVTISGLRQKISPACRIVSCRPGAYMLDWDAANTPAP